MAMENVAGDEPTFAITGPSNPAGGATGYAAWRTVVFEADATDGVKVKSGWPVDDFGTYEIDASRAVAINAADHTVYVTGEVHESDTTVEDFTTVRYYADGSNHSGGSHVWTNSWSDYGGKPSAGRDVKLDYSGNAYVTGVLLEGLNLNESATRKIAASNGSSTWSAVKHSTYGNEANSLSLSFEVESGSLVTYASITGLVKNASDTDVLTIRYNDSGTEQWANTYDDGGNHDNVGRHIEAVGKGDVYVIGQSNNDYVAIVYNSSGSTRFTPVTYNGTGSSVDDGRWDVVAGAGLVLYTGASTGSSTGLDFLTDVHTESATAYPATSYASDQGIFIGPNSYSYTYSDDSYLAGTPSSNVAKAHFGGSVSTSAVEMNILVEAHVSGTAASGVREKIEVWDYVNSAYVVVSDQPASTSDTNTKVMLKDDPKRFIDGSGNTLARVTFYHASSSSWSAAIDIVKWDIIN